jgi:hypothetical protein
MTSPAFECSMIRYLEEPRHAHFSWSCWNRHAYSIFKSASNLKMTAVICSLSIGRSTEAHRVRVAWCFWIIHVCSILFSALNLIRSAPCYRSIVHSMVIYHMRIYQSFSIGHVCSSFYSLWIQILLLLSSNWVSAFPTAQISSSKRQPLELGMRVHFHISLRIQILLRFNSTQT